MASHLEVRNLSKFFDDFQLHDITFSLPKGYIMGLIGPNGSGKTTTIKLILNMLKRSSGEIKIMGLDNIREEQRRNSESYSIPTTLVMIGRSRRLRNPSPFSTQIGALSGSRKCCGGFILLRSKR